MSTNSMIERMPAWLEEVWLVRYLDRKLGESETEWFESYFLDKADLIAAIEADNDMRDGFAILQRRDNVADMTTVAANFASRTVQQRMRVLIARAAAVVACVGAGWLLAHYLDGGTRGRDAIATIASPTRVVFDVLRGVPEPPLVHAGIPGQLYALVEVGMPINARNVSLSYENGQTVQLTVSSEGFASFLWPRERMSQPTRVTLAYLSNGETRHRELEIPSID